MTQPVSSSILDTHIGLPRRAGSCCSGFEAGADVDPDAAIVDEMLDDDQAQGTLDLHGQATANKHQRYAHGGSDV